MISHRNVGIVARAPLFVVAALLTACADVVSPPTSLERGDAVSNVILQHEGNDTEKHATAEARALIDSRGLVTIELTTGRFESSSGPVHFGETFAFTGYFKRTVNGTDLEFGGIKKCVVCCSHSRRMIQGPTRD